MGKLRGIPISISVVARYGGDMFLLESLNKLYLPIKHEVDVSEFHNVDILIVITVAG